jgi:hypothetical protein
MVKKSSSHKDDSKKPQATSSSSINKAPRQKLSTRNDKPVTGSSACFQAKVEQLNKASTRISFTQLDDDEPITWEGAIQLSQNDESFRALLTVSLMHPSFMMMLA